MTQNWFSGMRATVASFRMQRESDVCEYVCEAGVHVQGPNKLSLIPTPLVHACAQKMCSAHQPNPEERSERRADGAADEGTEHEPSALEDHREVGTEQQQRRGQRDHYGLQRRDCRRGLEQHLKGQSPRGFST
jgi:hypothetical protein